MTISTAEGDGVRSVNGESSPRSLPGNDLATLTRTVLEAIDEHRRPPTPTLRRRGRNFASWVWRDIGKVVAAGALVLVVAGFWNQGIQLRTLIDSAVADYRAVQGRSEIVERHLRLGDELLSVGSVEAAKSEYEQALKLDGTNTEAQLDLARTNVFRPIQAGDYDPELARMRIELLLKVNENDPIARAFLGDVFASQWKTAEALKQYNRALEVSPKLAYAHFSKGLLLDRLAQPEDALASYKRAAELSPENQTFANNYAYQLFRTRKYDRAIREYEDVLTIDYRFMLPYFELASAYRIRGDLANARRRQEDLMIHFDSAEARGLVRNQTKWIFDISEPHIPGDIVLTTWNEKRRYALMQLALTSYLQGHEDQARKALRQARRVKVGPPMPQAVESILRYDMKLLGAERKTLSGRLRGFAALLSG